MTPFFRLPRCPCEIHFFSPKLRLRDIRRQLQSSAWLIDLENAVDLVFRILDNTIKNMDKHIYFCETLKTYLKIMNFLAQKSNFLFQLDSSFQRANIQLTCDGNGPPSTLLPSAYVDLTTAPGQGNVLFKKNIYFFYELTTCSN